MLQAGDIFATKGSGLIGKLARKLMQPETDRFHYGLILQYIEDEDDYIILESIGKGIAVGRLSFYQGSDIKFYRVVDCPEIIRAYAPIALTQYGRAEYDYALLFKIIIQGFWLIIKHLFTEGKIRPIYPWELSWCRDNYFVCTEAVDAAYDMVNESIIPDAMTPVPSAYEWARLSNIIKEIKFEWR